MPKTTQSTTKKTAIKDAAKAKDVYSTDDKPIDFDKFYNYPAPRPVMVSAKKLIPLYDRIVVYPDPVAEKVTQGGIILVQDAEKDPPVLGTVLVVGPGEEKPLSVKPGDRVAYSRYAGNSFKFEDTEFKIFRESDIMCIVK